MSTVQSVPPKPSTLQLARLKPQESFRWKSRSHNEDYIALNTLASKSFDGEPSELCSELNEFALMQAGRLSQHDISKLYIDLFTPCEDGRSPYTRLIYDYKAAFLQLWSRLHLDAPDDMKRRVKQLLYEVTPETLHESTSEGEDEVTSSENMVANFQDENGNTLLHWAAATKDLLIAVLALIKGADVTLMNNLKQNALHLAVRSRSLHVFAYLLPYYSTESLGEVDYEGRTVLHFAALAGRSYALEILLEYMSPVDILKQDEQGNTALHDAVTNSEIKMDTIELIADFMQSINELGIQNNQGKTVLQLAKEKGRTEIAKMLKAKMRLNEKPDGNTLFGKLRQRLPTGKQFMKSGSESGSSN